MYRASPAYSAPRRIRRRPLHIHVGRLLTLIVVSTLVAIQVVSAAQTTITFLNFSDSSSLDLNADAAIVSSGGQEVLRLTPADDGQSGSAFLLAPITLADQASFSTMFSFQISDSGGIGDGDGVGADGIAFVVQTNSSSAGGSGGGIGYQGIDNSVGIEFDTYNNGEVNAGNHVGVDLNGSVTSVASVAVGTRMNDGNVWFAWVDYDGTTDALQVRLVNSGSTAPVGIPSRPDAATLQHTVDLAAVLEQTDAFVGFTSGTGSAWGNHDIRQWTFINDFNPVGVNAPPDANAGPDQTVTATGGATSVALNGSASTDPDGDTLSFSWSGPFNGGTATGATPTVTFASVGSHTVTLTVDDGNGGTDTDTVVINIAAAQTASAAPTASPAPTVRGDVLGGTPAPTAAALPDTLTSSETDAPIAVVLGALLLAAATWSAFALRRRRAVPQR